MRYNGDHFPGFWNSVYVRTDIQDMGETAACVIKWNSGKVAMGIQAGYSYLQYTVK